MGIKIISKDPKQPFRLWLPGILIYLFLLFVLLILFVPIVIVLIGLFIWNLIPDQSKMARAYTRIFFSITTVFWSIRGLTVDVESEDTIVKIKF